MSPFGNFVFTEESLRVRTLHKNQTERQTIHFFYSTIHFVQSPFWTISAVLDFTHQVIRLLLYSS